MTSRKPGVPSPAISGRRTMFLSILLLATGSPASAQWTRGKVGGLWVKTAFFYQKTDQRFDESGSKVPWLDMGESDARALYTDIVLGLHRDLDLWLQIPFFDLRFNRDFDAKRTTGFGDIRGWVRWKVVGLFNESTPVALRFGAKAPIGSSPLDAEIIPVGDGQWDLEGFAEVGHSFWPTPAYAELWLGYRARFENDEKAKDPGGEYVLLAEAGVNPTSRTLVKATLDGFWSRNWIVEGVLTKHQEADPPTPAHRRCGAGTVALERGRHPLSVERPELSCGSTTRGGDQRDAVLSSEQ